MQIANKVKSKLKKLLQKFDELVVSDSMDLLVTFVNLTIKIIVIAHYMACIFYYIGNEELKTNKRGWVLGRDLHKKGFKTKYITSMYWAFTTMSAVGYGDITPSTRDEMLVTITCMITSCGTFAYIVNRIGTVVMEFNQISDQFKERMMYVNRVMMKRPMPRGLRIKIRRYLDYEFEKLKEIKVDDEEMLQELNQSLKQKLETHLLGRIIMQIRFLGIEKFGSEMLTELTLHLKKRVFVTDDYLFIEKDKADCIYFIV